MVNVKDRVLNSPPPKDDSPHDQLLQAIRSEPRLRSISPNHYVETSRTKLSEADATPNTMRRLIKPDISLIKFSISDDDDSEIDEDYSDDEDRNKVTPSPLSPLTPLSPHSPWQQSDDELSDELDDAELAEIQAEIEDDTESLPRFVPYRRHSVDTCVKPIPQKPIGNPLECLSLTVEEVMHIRGVLTKAELECQMMDAELRDLLGRGKVCFTCKTTRFSLFGPWSTKCKFCKRNVCSKCFSKMQIPSEHFEHIPVYTLSPSPLSPKTSKDVFNVFENTGSAPSSPVLDRKSSPILVTTDTNGNSNRRSRPPMLRSMTVAKPPAPPPPPTLQGPMMAVCKDCKVLICHVIRASRLSVGKTGFSDLSEYSSQKPSRKFHLDLKPVYK